MATALTIRTATAADLPALARLRLALLQETGAALDAAAQAELLALNEAFFREQLGSPQWQHWVAEDGGAIVAIGTLALFLRPPYPGNLAGRDAYLLNMYTAETGSDQSFRFGLIAEYWGGNGFLRPQNAPMSPAGGDDASTKALDSAIQTWPRPKVCDVVAGDYVVLPRGTMWRLEPAQQTDLLLLGQKLASVAIVVDGVTVNIAAGFESGLNFVTLLGLGGGMPISACVSRPDIFASWGVSTGEALMVELYKTPGAVVAPFRARLRREARHTAGDLPALRRSRQGAPGAGFLFHRAHLSAVPGAWPGGEGSMSEMRRPGAHDPGTLAFGEHPGRHRRRPA